MIDLSNRNPAVADVARFFTYDHLPESLRAISQACHDLAVEMLETLPDSPQLTRGLNELLAAKDCFVRAAL